MSILTWTLLGFAVWTLFVLGFTVGVYRWARILTGRATVAEWRADVPQGCDWYRRAMRAHANCLENLPVFASLVLAAHIAEVRGPWLDATGVTLLGARILQTSVHVAFPQTELIAALRFAFFLVQFVCMLAIAGIVARGA